MRSLQSFVLLIFLLISTGNLSAQQHQASATLDTATILIGEQVTLTLELVKPVNSKIVWPETADSIGKIEVVSKGPVDTIPLSKGYIKLRQQMRITAFDSGYFVVPPYEFYPADKQNTTSTAATLPLLLTVQIMPVDTSSSFKAIKGVREVPFDWRDYITYIIAGIVILLLVLGGIYWYLRYKKNKILPVLFKKEPEIPPHVTALAALKELDAGKHWQNGQFKFYHAGISDIIREYIEKRWKIPAMEQTTDEILSNFHMASLEDALREKLTTVLRIADLAKFARLQPLAHENEQSMRDAVEFVNATAALEKEVKPEVTA